MSDLISRQAAIDALFELYEYQGDIDPTEAADLVRQGIFLAEKKIEQLPSAQPDLSEYSDKLWKKAYERGKAEALAQLEEAYISGETEAEARFHAQQRWIPCSERLPEEGQEILATTTDNAWGDVVIIRTYYKEMHKSVIAWMPLPEPYAERRTDE